MNEILVLKTVPLQSIVCNDTTNYFESRYPV